jgi:serine/threonine-protein phosphatase 4 regulatory subunit 1
MSEAYRDEPMAERPSSGGPTIEDLTYDDTLEDIDRIVRYGTSNVALQRLVHVKLMVDTARCVG